MDEEKKSGASGKGAARVGPYLIEEQVEQSNDSQEELYLATHETSGATALVRKHVAEEGRAPRKDWRVFLGSWASRGYSVMEVEHTDWARSQDRQTAESLLHTLEGALEEVRRMVSLMSDSHESRLRWRLGWGVAGAPIAGLPCLEKPPVALLVPRARRLEQAALRARPLLLG